MYLFMFICLFAHSLFIYCIWYVFVYVFVYLYLFVCLSVYLFIYYLFIYLLPRHHGRLVSLPIFCTQLPACSSDGLHG